MEIKNAVIIGAGTMGNGICHVFAQHGYTTTMVDIRKEALEKALSVISNNMDRQVKKGILTEDEKIGRYCDRSRYRANRH
jgi:3-hydroxybutyryl-CoA dehydrogenase